MKLKKFLRASLLLIITIFLFGPAVKESEIKAKSGNDIPRILESEEACSSYIYIVFGEETTYPNGFLYGVDQRIIQSRRGISGIYTNYAKYGLEEPLTISADSTVKLCFENTITNLESFFDSTKDINVNNIKTIDLSHFDSSSITNVGYMFKNCQSLVCINLANFKSENSGNMFKGIFNNLEYVDLTNAQIGTIFIRIGEKDLETCYSDCITEQICPIIIPETKPTSNPPTTSQDDTTN